MVVMKHPRGGCSKEQPLFWPIRTLRRYWIVMLLLLMLHAVAATAAVEIPPPSCSESEPNSVTYAFGVETSKTDGQLAATATFGLLEAVEPLQLGMVAFYNGVQVDTLSDQAMLDCGQEVEFAFSVETAGVPDGVLHVFPRWLPLIPDPIARSSPAHPFPNEDAYIYGTRLADVNTTVLGDEPNLNAPIDQKDFRTIPTDIHTGHLFIRSPEQPTYIEYLEPGQDSLDFHLYFSETVDDQLSYTITCLLDDVQFPAFHGEIIWTSSMPYNHAALIDARAADLAPGWHKIQCYVLNGLVRETADRISEFPHQIYPLFIYVP